MKIICNREEVSLKTLALFMDKTEQDVLKFISGKTQFIYNDFLFTIDRPEILYKQKKLVTNIVTTKESVKGTFAYFDGELMAKNKIATHLKMSEPSFYHLIKGKKSFDIKGHHIELVKRRKK